MGDRTRPKLKRRASEVPALYNYDCISSQSSEDTEEDTEMKTRINRNTYGYIANTPVRSRLSRNRTVKTEDRLNSSSSKLVGEPTSLDRRQSSRKAIKTVPFHHYPYEVTPNKNNPTPVVETYNHNTSKEDKSGTILCNGVTTPKKSAPSPNAKTPKRSTILDKLKNSVGYVNAVQNSITPRASSSVADDDKSSMSKPIRLSSRDRQSNKQYVSKQIGDLRISLTPVNKTTRMSIRNKSGSRALNVSTTSVVRCSGRKSTSSSSKSPVASHSKSRTPKSVKTPTASNKKLQTPKSPGSVLRGRGRPPTKGKPSISPKPRMIPMKRTAITDEGEEYVNEKEKDYDSGEITTESETDDNMSTEESESNSDCEDNLDNSKTKSTQRKNVSRRLEDMDLENALTPDVLKHLRTKHIQSVTPRRLLQAHQGNEQESPNPESYFLATTRLKYLPEAKAIVPNDARRGKGGAAKKPRKGTRGTGGKKIVNLPERPKPNFSVTKEANRVASSKLVVPLDGNKHAEEIDSILRNIIIPDFSRWMHFMSEGFNIMLHGYGSKISVFQAFKAHLGGEWLVITVNGLYPKLSPRKFLLDLCNSLELEDKIRVVGSNMDVVAEEIYDQLKCADHPRVFLLVKNFESLAIRHPSFLSVLSSIARVKWIHILASSDNVNAFLGVNQNQTVQLNFCWIPCSTFQPYEEELTWVPGVFGEEASSSGAKSTLQYVLKSLTGNARKAFSILASLQLVKMQGSKGKRSKEFTGVEFRDLARRCRERFIAHSDPALKTLLIEFVDHKLINHSGKSKNVGNLLTIELDKDTIEELANAGL